MSRNRSLACGADSKRRMTAPDTCAFRLPRSRTTIWRKIVSMLPVSGALVRIDVPGHESADAYRAFGAADTLADIHESLHYRAARCRKSSFRTLRVILPEAVFGSSGKMSIRAGHL